MAVKTGLMRRLYRGETNIDLVGRRKTWYIASVVIILICVASMAFRGFNFGIEFAGGNQFQVPVKSDATLTQVRSSVENQGIEVSSAQTAGSGNDARYVIRTPQLSDQQRTEVLSGLASSGHVTTADINSSQVSSSWGKNITNDAIKALVVFLIAVCVYLWLRFERKMAFAALLALLHDLLLTAGVYSLVGFEVSPGTVIGLLTILGFSLYDTVVVFDKVDENTRGILGSSRLTYAEAANLAVNQTLMRSINTSLIGLLPVAGLLFVGAGLLGVGTLKDLALVLFVGMLTGAYSSLFLATPWLVDFKLLEPRYKLHSQRLLARRAAPPSTKAGVKAPAGKGPAGKAKAVRQTVPADSSEETSSDDLPQRVDALAASSAPRVGARPASGKRPGGARGGRPSGNKRRR